MFREQGQHVVEEGNTRPDGGPACSINVQCDRDAGLPGGAADVGPSEFHLAGI
jgi:hypothetical protein